MFTLKLRDTYLIGLACEKCISNWLSDKNVGHETIDKLPIRRELIVDLQTEGDASVLYEISSDGHSTRMECYIERHPNCTCTSETLRNKSSKFNFAFSSVEQIQSARYGTPAAQLWLTTAVKSNGTSRIAVKADRGASRLSAAIPEAKELNLEAFAEATVQSYKARNKQPLLIVGSSNWMRVNAPFFLLQQFDIHLFFYPNAESAWVIGACGLNKVKSNAEPIWSYSSSNNIETALKQALWGLIQYATSEPIEQAEKLNVWTTHWIYRCPKIALKDILVLEAYPERDITMPVPITSHVLRQVGVFQLVQGGKL